MLTGRPPHLKSFDYTGCHRYSLTFCTNGRQRLFRDQAVVDLVVSHIARAAAERDFAILTYCFMQDHVHLLVHGQTESADLKAFLSLAKQYSGYYYKKQFGSQLWQRYSYERTLRKEEHSFAVARYILENPVRAKMVESVADYPFLGSLVCELAELIESVGSGQDTRSG